MTLPDPRTTVQDYVEMSHRFLDHAQSELNAGRRLQASEKVWGAVSHALSAIGKQRGWSHKNNFEAKDISSQMGMEFGRSVALGNGYARAFEQHRNFHRNSWRDEDIQESIDEVREYVAELDTVRELPAKPVQIGSKTQQDRIGDLLGVPDELRDEKLPIKGKPDPFGFSRFDNNGNPRDPLDDPGLGDPERRRPH